MPDILAYTAEDFTATIPVADYIAGFRQEARFVECCRQCGSYGRSWGCPPFSFDVEARLRQYRYLLLTATRITPGRSGLPLSQSMALMRPERERLEERLREMERRYGGLASAYVGSCLYCAEGSCTRLDGRPCRHPDLVRPSLEAYGFDIGKTLSELFGITLLWGTDGCIPEYLTLVCGFFHNVEGLKDFE